jgi:hypothetical protein
MPKRVIDFDAMWASDKLAACAEWAQVEYAWLYGLADCNGCFELTNLRVIWGRVAAVRKNLSLERVAQVFDEFHDKGLLFRWSDGGKRYGHWTGSDVPGRLPPPSWRNRLERLAPPVPRAALEEYVAAHARVGATQCETERGAERGVVSETRIAARGEKAEIFVLKPCLEAAQAQDLDLDWEGNRDLETHTPCLEENSRPREDNSPPEKSKSVCESASADLETETKSKSVPVEETNNKTIPGEEKNKNEIAAEGENKNHSPIVGNSQKPSPVASKGDPMPRTPEFRETGNGASHSSCHPEAASAEGSVAQATNRATSVSSPVPSDGSFVVRLRRTPQDDNVRLGDRAENPRVQGSAGYTARRGGDTRQGSAGYTARDDSAEKLGEIWEQERGSLPELRAMTPERLARCKERLRNAASHSAEKTVGEPGNAKPPRSPEGRDEHGAPGSAIPNAIPAAQESAIARFLEDFREAVRRAAATPFLCGAGPAGWRANFDWIIANDTNYLKVLEGRYDSGEGARDATRETPDGNCSSGYPSPANRLGMTAGAGGGARTQSGAPRWAAERAAREESVRRELRVGMGPSIDHVVLREVRSAEGDSRGGNAMGNASSVETRSAMRADVVERFRRRGQPETEQSQGRA